MSLRRNPRGLQWFDYALVIPSAVFAVIGTVRHSDTLILVAVGLAVLAVLIVFIEIVRLTLRR